MMALRNPHDSNMTILLISPIALFVLLFYMKDMELFFYSLLPIFRDIFSQETKITFGAKLRLVVSDTSRTYTTQQSSHPMPSLTRIARYADKPAKAPADAAEKPKSDQEKAQLRRAQVRRAQIQHRQRKANYTKQLEIDVSELRDLVSLTEKETAALFKENSLIREALENAGLPLVTATQQSPEAAAAAMQQVRLDAGPVGSPAAVEESPELFGDIDIDDLTVTLSMDAALGAPCFHISSNSSGASVAAETPRRTIAGVALTWEQEQRAVNFILGYVLSSPLFLVYLRIVHGLPDDGRPPLASSTAAGTTSPWATSTCTTRPSAPRRKGATRSWPARTAWPRRPRASTRAAPPSRPGPARRRGPASNGARRASRSSRCTGSPPRSTPATSRSRPCRRGSSWRAGTPSRSCSAGQCWTRCRGSSTASCAASCTAPSLRGLPLRALLRGCWARPRARCGLDIFFHLVWAFFSFSFFVCVFLGV
ncbi:hypothetical protein J3458_002848 [Metarhizium acridum]|uniref:uncharacterized protein n=1 Tax=Metarhizium acridum TaxID=92637 RepID=UPI001C6BB463|nr:hypothetical protein J3458_002848 [Metarhizium acridum]